MKFFLEQNGRFKVGHDLVLDSESVDDFVRKVQEEYAGSVETGAVLGWRLIRELMPGCKIVTVHRPVGEVKKSLERFGLYTFEMEERAEMLNALSSVPGVESISYDALDDPEVCKWLFEYCHGEDWDPEWWQMLRTLNIQVDMAERLKKIVESQPKTLAMKNEILNRIAGLSSCLN